MVTLVHVSSIRGRLNLQDDAGINATITHAIGASTPLLEAKLATVFSKRSVVDTFYPDESSPKHKGFYVLKLSSGFVRPLPALTVTYGDSMQLIATAIPPTECLVKPEIGHVYIPDTYMGSWVRVAYDAGYEDSDAIPSWLEEAATVHTISMMSAQQIGDPRPELSEVFKFMMAASTTILDAHIRSRSYTISPL